MSSPNSRQNDSLDDGFSLVADAEDWEEALGDATDIKTRRMLARRRLEEKEEMRRLRDEVHDPLFELASGSNME